MRLLTKRRDGATPRLSGEGAGRWQNVRSQPGTPHPPAVWGGRRFLPAREANQIAGALRRAQNKAFAETITHLYPTAVVLSLEGAST